MSFLDPNGPAHYQRTRHPYHISSDPSLLSLDAINAGFDSPAMYWCTALPLDTLKTTLDNSLCLGLYQLRPAVSPSSAEPGAHMTYPTPTQIGLARLITDRTTFAYLTDVYVVPKHQKKGLGKWLIECVDEVLGMMPYLRRAVLIAGVGEGEEFYGKSLGFSRVEQGLKGVVLMDRKGPAGEFKRVGWEVGNEENGVKEEEGEGDSVKGEPLKEVKHGKEIEDESVQAGKQG
jgi:GNAT superfamily N-acetyltransferase